MVTREVHRSSLRRLICPAQDHLIFLTVLIISMTFVLSLTQMLVFLSLYVMLSILLSILVCAAASLFCACLVSVQVSAPYTCLFRQMARWMMTYSYAPMLFNIYTNDRPIHADTRSFIYADDLCIASQGNDFNNIEASLTSALNTMITYYDTNQLRANPSKTQVCAFHLEECCLPHGTHTTNARHQLFHHQPAASRLKSRKSFMRTVTPLDSSASSSILGLWKHSLTDVPASIQMGLEVAESLPAGSGEDWLCWRALNRLRTGVGRAKTVMRRWGYLDGLRLRGATYDGPPPLLPSTRRGPHG